MITIKEIRNITESWCSKGTISAEDKVKYIAIDEEDDVWPTFVHCLKECPNEKHCWNAKVIKVVPVTPKLAAAILLLFSGKDVKAKKDFLEFIKGWSEK